VRVKSGGKKVDGLLFVKFQYERRPNGASLENGRSWRSKGAKSLVVRSSLFLAVQFREARGSERQPDLVEISKCIHKWPGTSRTCRLVPAVPYALLLPLLCRLPPSSPHPAPPSLLANPLSASAKPLATPAPPRRPTAFL
jgi:hypothetical protein